MLLKKLLFGNIYSDTCQPGNLSRFIMKQRIIPGNNQNFTLFRSDLNFKRLRKPLFTIKSIIDFLYLLFSFPYQKQFKKIIS
jgi:hypothetical protein